MCRCVKGVVCPLLFLPKVLNVQSLCPLDRDALCVCVLIALVFIHSKLSVGLCMELCMELCMRGVSADRLTTHTPEL